MVVDVTPLPNKPRSGMMKRKAEENSPSKEAVSKNNLTEIPPMIMVSWKKSGYNDNSTSKKLKDVTLEERRS